MPTIKLDCAPGSMRPGDLIGAVVKETILEKMRESHPDATVGRFFGCWTWSFPSISQAEWNEKVRPIIKPRIVALYNRGMIRYGEF